MMHWNDGRWGHVLGAWGLVGRGLWLLLVIAAIGLVAWLVSRAVTRRATVPPPGSPVSPARLTPFEVLDDRLARGEIDLTTYRATREELLRGQPAPPVV